MLNNNKKREIFQSKNYSTRETFLEWLEATKAIVEENKNIIDNLLTQQTSQENTSKELKELQDKLEEAATEEVQKGLEKDIQLLVQNSTSGDIQIDSRLIENKFIFDELTKLKNPDFLTERKQTALDNNDEQESVILADLEATLGSKITDINKLLTFLENQKSPNEFRSSSSLLTQIAPVPKLKEDLPIFPNRTPFSKDDSDDENFKDKIKQKVLEKIEPIRSYLKEIEEKMEEYLKSKPAWFDSSNREIMVQLLPLIKKSLKENTITQYNLLLATWKEDYPQWDDWQWGVLIWFEEYLKSYNYEEERDSDEVSDLKLKTESLERSLRETREDLEKRVKEFVNAQVVYSRSLTKAVADTKKQYSDYVSPRDSEKIEELAKKKLRMKTLDEVEKKVKRRVREFKVPLEAWRSAFTGYNNPEEVADEFKRYKNERDKIRNNLGKVKNDYDSALEKMNSLETQLSSHSSGYGTVADGIREKEIKISGFEQEVQELNQRLQKAAELVQDFRKIVNLNKEIINMDEEKLEDLEALVREHLPEIVNDVLEESTDGESQDSSSEVRERDENEELSEDENEEISVYERNEENNSDVSDNEEDIGWEGRLKGQKEDLLIPLIEASQQSLSIVEETLSIAKDPQEIKDLKEQKSSLKEDLEKNKSSLSKSKQESSSENDSFQSSKVDENLVGGDEQSEEQEEQTPNVSETSLETQEETTLVKSNSISSPAESESDKSDTETKEEEENPEKEIEEEFNENELDEKGKEILRQIKSSKKLLEALEKDIEAKSHPDPQYYVQQEERKSDLESKLLEKKEELRALIDTQKENQQSFQEMPINKN